MTEEMKRMMAEDDVLQAEIIDELEKEDTAFTKLKRTAKEALDKSMVGAEKGIRWAMEHPKEAAGIIGGAFVGYTKFVRPILQDRKEYKESHTYTFYDYVNHKTLYLRRDLDWDEHMELCKYLDDRSRGKRYAAEWLRDRGLLKRW